MFRSRLVRDADQAEGLGIVRRPTPSHVIENRHKGHMTGTDPIAFAFAAFNLLRLASYLPQIVAVIRDRNGATAISFSCWAIWVGANASTALYAGVNLGDAKLALISAFNALCCTVVIVLAAWKRFEAAMLASRGAARN
jgi:hypothetical protein